jgi:MucR family transcriptional regulator, transcriptional regulator of exopolysaccharide biosynthesis
VDNTILDLTAQIVSAHVSHNALPSDQLPSLISQVHHALATVGQTPVAATHTEPVVPVKKSVFADHLICLVCGKSFKTLKRHVMSDHQMTVEQYRERFELPRSYAMVAADYTKARSAMAKRIGLGRGGRAAAPKKAGRKRG